MSHEDDIELWERELHEAGIVDLFPPREPKKRELKKYTSKLAAASIISVGIIVMAQALDATADAASKPRIADPATYSYSYGQDAGTVIIPTPDEKDGKSSMMVQFSCGSDGSLTMASTSRELPTTFTVDDIEEMKIAGVTSENPCRDGLSQEDSKNLGSIVVKTGFAAYNIPPQPTTKS
jgi:hypothetical protein